MIYQYKYKFYLNASHYITIDNKKGAAHSHSFEIIVDVALIEAGGFEKHNIINEKINELIAPFQDRLINELPPFDKTDPTLENMCVYFKEKISRLLFQYGWLLLTIEMAENPSRLFAINVAEDIVARGRFMIDESEIMKPSYVDMGRNEKLMNSVLDKFKLKNSPESDYDYDIPDAFLEYDID